MKFTARNGADVTVPDEVSPLGLYRLLREAGYLHNQTFSALEFEVADESVVVYRTRDGKTLLQLDAVEVDA